MRLTVTAVLLALTMCGSPAWAQQAEREAEIKQAVPYYKMLREQPTMTWSQYDRAVRELAQQQLQSEGLSGGPLVPEYEPPPVSGRVTPLYSPPEPYSTTRRYVSPYTPQTQTTYDWRSGNTYRTRKEAGGDTKVNGYNPSTGSMWETTIKPNGSMKGYDSRTNPWTYDSRSKTYVNYGTGEICVGEGYARVCS